MRKIWPKVKVIIWSDKVMLNFSRSLTSPWTHFRCFHRSSLSIKSYCRKLLVIFHDLKWPWRHDEGVTSHIPIRGVKSTCKLMNSNGFRPKEVPFNFLPLTYNGEVAKLTSLRITDIKILRLTFYRYCYGNQLLKISRWSIIWCSYDEHSNLFWPVTWWPDLQWPRSEIFTICAEKMYEEVCQKPVGCVQTPPLGPARV